MTWVTFKAMHDKGLFYDTQILSKENFLGMNMKKINKQLRLIKDDPELVDVLMEQWDLYIAFHCDQ